MCNLPQRPPTNKWETAEKKKTQLSNYSMKLKTSFTDTNFIDFTFLQSIISYATVLNKCSVRDGKSEIKNKTQKNLTPLGHSKLILCFT